LAIPDLRGAIIASFPLAVYVIDVHGVVQLWNRACEELFGWTAPEVLGKYLPVNRSMQSHSADSITMVTHSN